MNYSSNEYGCCSRNQSNPSTSEITVYVDDYELIIQSIPIGYSLVSATNYAKFKAPDGTIYSSPPNYVVNNFKWYTRSGGGSWVPAATGTQTFVSHCYSYDYIKVECDIHYTGQSGNTCTLSCSKTCSLIREAPNRLEQSFDQSNEELVNIYPNPNEGSFYLNVQESDDQSGYVYLELSDLSGKKIWNNYLAEENGKVNTYIQLPAWITNGIYLLEIKRPNKKTIRKIIVQRQ